MCDPGRKASRVQIRGLVEPGPTLPPAVTEQAGARSPLESYVLVIVLAVLAIAVLAAVLLRRKRWGVGLKVVAWTVVSILVIATCGAAVNSYVGYVRSASDLGRLAQIASGGKADDPEVRTTSTSGAGGVRITDVSLPDPKLGVPSGRTRVLLPPGYDDPKQAGRRYPVVYLVHGYPSGGPDDWLSGGGAAQTLQALSDTHAAQPMIVVAVDATAGSGTDWECLNVPGGPQLESYLTTTVPRAIDAKFRTYPDAGNRAIGGMSGGAFCSLNLGLRHQDTYSVILSSEPEDDPGAAGASLLAGHPDQLRANTPRLYMPTMRFVRPLSVMLHAGIIADSDVRRARQMAEALAKSGPRVALRVEPGEWHTWRTARIGLPYLLAFASENFACNHQPTQKPAVQAGIPPAGVPPVAGVRPVPTSPIPPPPAPPRDAQPHSSVH